MFKEGDRVIHKTTRDCGTILEVDDGVAYIERDNGCEVDYSVSAIELMPVNTQPTIYKKDESKPATIKQEISAKPLPGINSGYVEQLDDSTICARLTNWGCETVLIKYAEKRNVKNIDFRKLRSDNAAAIELQDKADPASIRLAQSYQNDFNDGMKKIRKLLVDRGIPYIANKGLIEDIFHQLNNQQALVEGKKCLVLREPTMFAFACLAFGKENVLFLTDDQLMANTISEIDPNFNVGYWNRDFKQNFGLIQEEIEQHLEEFDTMQFDIIIGNPPFQAPRIDDGEGATGNTIWPQFVELSYKLLVDGGTLALIHPAGWRKPRSSKQGRAGKYDAVWDRLTNFMHLQYLSIQDSTEGKKVFGANTRFDWYVAKKGVDNRVIKVRGVDGIEGTIDLDVFNFIPNKDFSNILPLLAKSGEATCDVIYDRSAYGADKDWTSDTKDTIFCHPLIHTTPKEGVRYMYSKHANSGQFGISKVIFGDSGIDLPVIDVTGKYGMTQHSMAIPVIDLADANKLVDFLTSDSFQKMLTETCIWSNFQIDWQLFAQFKEGFWR